MNPKNERDSKSPKNSADAPAPRKRFRIEKLEERIAPKRGGNGTNNCSGGGGGHKSFGASDTLQ